MKRVAIILSAVSLASLLVCESTQAAVRIWGNTATDFNDGASWTGGLSPAGNNVAKFDIAMVTQPSLSASISTSGIFFDNAGSSGYNLTSAGAFTLTLTGTNTSGSSGASNSDAAAIRNEITAGTNTITANVILASGSGTSSFVQAGAGTLVVNGDISGNALSLRGGTGVIELNGVNTFTALSINTAGQTVVFGNDSAMGAGTFTNSNTSTIQAGGGARMFGNAIVLAGNMTISGSNAMTFNGSFTSSDSDSRTLTVSNTGGATLTGNVFLQEAAASDRTFEIKGTSAVVISGVIADGGTGPATLEYTGSSTLTLSNTGNTYSGGTQLTIAGSTIIADGDGTLGTGNVSLFASSVTLTLQNGATNNYISDGASISIVTDATADLNFTGLSDAVSDIILDGASQAALNNFGTYGAVGSGADFESAFFSGDGTLELIPEASTWAMLGIGTVLLGGAQWLRRKRS